MIADALGLILLLAIYVPLALLGIVIAAVLAIVTLLCCVITWLRHRCTGVLR